MGVMDSYKPPSAAPSSDVPSSGVMSTYKPPVPAAAAAAPEPIYLEPRSLSQAGSDIANFGRVAANTLGIGDSLLASQRAINADIMSNANPSNAIPANLAAEKAKTAQASQDIGPAASFAANLVGAAPVAGATGKTLGTALAPYTGKWLGGVLGSAGESAGVAAGSAAGRGDPMGQAALIAGAGGAALGLPGGVVGRGTLPTTPSATDFERQAQGKYGFADQINFSPKQIGQLMIDASRNIAGQSPRVIQEGQGAQSVLGNMASEAYQHSGMSAARLNDYLKKLHSSQTDDAVPEAGKIGQGQIKDFLQTAAPVTPHAPGIASQVLTDAKTLHGQSQDLNRIQGWQDEAAQGGKDISSQAQSFLNSQKGKDYAPQGTPQNEAYQMIASQTAKGRNWPYALKHYILAPAAGALAGEGVGYLTGDENSPWVHAAQDIGMAAMFMGASKAGPATTGAINTAAQQRAIDAAKATIGTGRIYRPMKAPSPTGDALRRLYSQMTPGNLPGTNP